MEPRFLTRENDQGKDATLPSAGPAGMPVWIDLR